MSEKPKEKAPNDILRKDVESFVKNGAVNRAADYAQRGRIFQALSLDQLAEKWCASFRDMAADPFDPDKNAVEGDLSSEFVLRGIEPPFDSVREELDRYTSTVSRAFEQKQKADPQDFERANKELERDLDAYRALRNKSN